ncbi:hypothetical protein LINPERHAP1_LOCUS20099 [Linum perenne]
MYFSTTSSLRTNWARSRSKKTLHWAQLRLAPPPTKETNKSSKFKFKFNNEVDAFHQDGW